jgi:4'-phosphopantetheinyl transferase EntD
MSHSMIAERSLASLFPAKVHTTIANLDRLEGMLYPEEAALVSTAGERRLREFRAGRLCARRVLADLGITRFPVLAGPDRAPIWPAGIVGSISHSSDAGAAAAARRSEFAGVGLDVETAEPLPRELWDLVLSESEGRRLHGFGVSPGLMAKVFFSAKECVYKCQYPLTRAWLNFRDVDVDVDPVTGEFRAEIRRTESGSFPSPVTLTGKYRIADGMVQTAIVLPAHSFPNG